MDKAVPSAKSASMSISLPVSFPASWSMAVRYRLSRVASYVGTSEYMGMANRNQISNTRPKWRVSRVMGHKSCGWVDIFAVAALRMRFERGAGMRREV